MPPRKKHRAATMLETAIEAYTSFGMPQHATLTRELVATIASI